LLLCMTMGIPPLSPSEWRNPLYGDVAAIENIITPRVSPGLSKQRECSACALENVNAPLVFSRPTHNTESAHGRFLCSWLKHSNDMTNTIYFYTRKWKYYIWHSGWVCLMDFYWYFNFKTSYERFKIERFTWV
jgi:hypothetical protein